MMYKTLFFSLLLFVSLSSVVSLAASNAKPRVIATTDGESDDQSSMVRFLMYASDFDIAGIVQVNGVQKNGHSKEKWIEGLIDRYDQCLPNLRKHNPDYPDKAYLLSVLKVGNENSADLGKAPPLISDNEGAQLIIKVLTDDDPRPVHILAWGGANTQANALWQIKTNYSAEVWEKAAAKARLYCIWYQDGGGKWIEKNLPEIKIYEAGADPNHDLSWRYVWDYMSVDLKYKNRMSANPKELQTIMDTPWWTENIFVGHGPLTAAYNLNSMAINKTPQNYTSEGDTPSFMTLINNGLCQDTDYTLGGWGGRAVYAIGNHMVDGGDENSGKVDFHYTFQRWLPAVQNDWAARADWCVADSFSKANHQPIAAVNGDLVRDVTPNQTVVLDASTSTDPDNDTLTYKWWQYFEADNAVSKLTINNDTSKNNATFIVPNEPDKQLHVILEVTDNGTPSLKSYQRVIFNIINKVGLPNVSDWDVTVNPNPTSDYLNISQNTSSIEAYSIQIINSEGQVLLSKMSTNKIENINISNLTQGIYFVKMKNANGNLVRKFIKQE